MRPTNANAALVLHQVVLMPQVGAPWDYLPLDDLASPLLADYKLYIFLNAFSIDPAQRAALHAKLKRNQATAVFYYVQGYLEDGRESLEAVEALTGIRIVEEDLASIQS